VSQSSAFATSGTSDDVQTRNHVILVVFKRCISSAELRGRREEGEGRVSIIDMEDAMEAVGTGAAQAMPHAMHMMHSYFYWGPQVCPFFFTFPVTPFSQSF
jgi:hypothetical protein